MCRTWWKFHIVSFLMRKLVLFARSRLFRTNGTSYFATFYVRWTRQRSTFCLHNVQYTLIVANGTMRNSFGVCVHAVILEIKISIMPTGNQVTSILLCPIVVTTGPPGEHVSHRKGCHANRAWNVMVIHGSVENVSSPCLDVNLSTVNISPVIIMSVKVPIPCRCFREAG